MPHAMIIDSNAHVRQASLPMYDLPEIRAQTDHWWAGIAKHLHKQGIHDAPATLLHDRPVGELWRNDALFMSQCCGFDIVFGYRERLQVLLTTDWSATGCEQGQYSSWVIVHEDNQAQSIAELLGSTAVINGPESHSGMNALMAFVAPHTQNGLFFQTIITSGAHVDSLHAIRTQQADVAAIDCVTYALLQHYRPTALAGVRILGQTRSAPAHPYVTLADTESDTVQRMQTALANAFADVQLQGVRDDLLLRGALFNGVGHYRAIADDFQFDACLLSVLAEIDDHHLC